MASSSENSLMNGRVEKSWIRKWKKNYEQISEKDEWKSENAKWIGRNMCRKKVNGGMK
jgi:hypothetical protein